MNRDRTKATKFKLWPVSWHKRQLKKYVDKFKTVPPSTVGLSGYGNRWKAWCELKDEGYFKGKKYEDTGRKL